MESRTSVLSWQYNTSEQHTDALLVFHTCVVVHEVRLDLHTFPTLDRHTWQPKSLHSLDNQDFGFKTCGFPPGA